MSGRKTRRDRVSRAISRACVEALEVRRLFVVYDIIPTDELFWVPPDDGSNHGHYDEWGHILSGLTGRENISEATGVRYANGRIDITDTDLSSNGFGGPWGITRYWSNAAASQSTNSHIGNGWIINQQPYIVQTTAASGTGILVSLGGGSFHTMVNGHGQGYDPATLTQDSANHQYIYTTGDGQTIYFDDFSFTDPQGEINRQGQFKKWIDPNGKTIEVKSRTSDGKIQEIIRTDGTGTSTKIESWYYTYGSSGGATGQVINVKLRRGVGDPSDGSYPSNVSWTTVRQVDYDYYNSAANYGNLGDLKKATVETATGASSPIETFYYRYYTSDTTDGYTGALRMVFEPRSYARLMASSSASDPDSISDAAPYADRSMTYWSTDKRVHTVTTQQKGSSTSTSTPHGLGTYTYSYSEIATAGDGWFVHMQTTELLPDGTTYNTVFSNNFGETVIKLYETPSGHWGLGYEYDDIGQLRFLAEPSAFGINTSGEHLLFEDQNNQKNYYILDDAGLVHENTYYTDGEGTGRFESQYLRQGYSGTQVEQLHYTYTSHENHDSYWIFPIASITRYQDGTSGTAQETDFTYDWFEDPIHTSDELNQIEKQTTSFPAVTHNGSGSADGEITVRDIYGRTIWSRDPDGYLDYFEYDVTTGGMTKQIVDAFQSPAQPPPVTRGTNLPAAQALETDYTVDLLGRTTSITNPNSNVTYIVYLDTTHEKRVYPGFSGTTSSGTTTGPIEVYREYWPAPNSSEDMYFETLTSSAAPHVVSSVPDGGETLNSSNIQTLKRQITNAGGQIVLIDRYVTLTGVTYSQATAQLGSSTAASSSGNYQETTQDYDNRGRLVRTKSPSGTITVSTLDDLSRVTAISVGTDDGTGSSNNMVTTTQYQYDDGSVGNGNLTKITEKPAGGTADRVTRMWYDWRDRMLVMKEGVEADESTTSQLAVNRPLYEYAYDNLDELTAVNQYDGDNIAVATTGGIPAAVSAGGALRARTIYSYDERGRQYRSGEVKVAQVSGSGVNPGDHNDSVGLFTNSYYNGRGNVIEQIVPGGQVYKMVYDGAGRLTTSYVTDGSGGTSYSNPVDVSNDYVLTQSQNLYDDDGNVIFTIRKDRFHNDTLPGQLGDINGKIDLNQDGIIQSNEDDFAKARVSYAEHFYDEADRLTDSVDLGTYGAGGPGGGLIAPVDSSPPTSSSPTALLTHYHYDDAGRVDSVTDPRAIKTTTTYDKLGRTVETIENDTSSSPGNDHDRKTDYT